MRALIVSSLAILLARTAFAEVNCNVGIEFRDDGRFRACVLNGDHRLHVGEGIVLTCADGHRLERHRDGALERCTLAAPVMLDGTACVPGSLVVFDAEGRLLQCKKPAD